MTLGTHDGTFHDVTLGTHDGTFHDVTLGTHDVKGCDKNPLEKHQVPSEMTQNSHDEPFYDVSLEKHDVTLEKEYNVPIRSDSVLIEREKDVLRRYDEKRKRHEGKQKGLEVSFGRLDVLENRREQDGNKHDMTKENDITQDKTLMRHDTPQDVTFENGRKEHRQRKYSESTPIEMARDSVALLRTTGRESVALLRRIACVLLACRCRANGA